VGYSKLSLDAYRNETLTLEPVLCGPLRIETKSFSCKLSQRKGRLYNLPHNDLHMRIRWTESLPSFPSYPRLLGFFWKDLRESFGERFSFPVRCPPLSRPFQQKAGRWKRVVSFSSSKRKLTYPGVRTSQNQTLSGGGLNFAVDLWC